jgi:hypothetical protein
MTLAAGLAACGAPGFGAIADTDQRTLRIAQSRSWVIRDPSGRPVGQGMMSQSGGPARTGSTEGMKPGPQGSGQPERKRPVTNLYRNRNWGDAVAALTVAALLSGCGQASRSQAVSPVADAGGISQSSEINQSTSGSGSGSSSVSVSRQVVDNGDGTVTITETRQVNGRTETSRRTVKKSDADKAVQQQQQIIQQRIETH